MTNLDLPHFERNLGFLHESEQNALENSVVSIAGAGGDGGLLAVQLARMGVGEVRLADPDPFETENSNRQAVCTEKTIGINKAVAVGEYIAEINPRLKVKIYDEGITPENTEEFTSGADLIIDETEFTMHALGIMLAREARKNGQPVLTALNIGFGAMVTTFDPKGKSLERILGFRDDQPLDEIAEQSVPLSRWLPYLPHYIDLDVFKKVAMGEKPAPSIAPGVASAASLGASQAFLNLVGTENKRPKPVYAPKALISDPVTGEMKKVRFNNLTHFKHLGVIIVKNLFHRNPSASY